MAWIESHQELGSHPKVIKLSRILGIPKTQVVGHLHYFWWWALDYAQGGALERFDALDIAIGGEWDGDSDVFLDALIRAGFIDQTDAGLVIHDWDLYGGKLQDKRAKDAERKRAAREAERTSAGRPSDGPTTAHVEKRREENSREDERGCDGANAPDAPPEEPVPLARARRIPGDFAIGEKLREWGYTKSLTDSEMDRATEGFVAYWQGTGKTRVDWEATWRNWMLKEINDGRLGKRKSGFVSAG